MAMAKKCDRCDKLYETYTDNKGHNGIAFANIERNGQANFFMSYDLCPECLKIFDEFMAKEK